MRLIVREEVVEDLKRIHDWIAADRPRAAFAMVDRIRDRIGSLTDPGMAEKGRPGRQPGTRELIQRPYVIVYKVDRDVEEITVLAIFHGRQDR